MRKNIARVLLMSLTLSAISPMQDAQAASKITLSNKSLSMKVGATKTVKANKAVKWKTSNKKIATVKKLSTKKAKITAKKAGSCKITATAGKKKATIRVTVKKVVKPTKKPTVTVTPTSTPKVTVTPVSTSTVEPTTTTVVPTPSTNPAIVASTEPVTTAVVSTEVPTVEPTETPVVTSAEPSTEPTATEAVTVEPTETPVVTSTEPALTPSAEPTTEPVATIEPTVTPVAATLEPTTTPAATPITVSASGISMTLDHYENGILTYTIENTSEIDMDYDYGYYIEKEINGEWIQVTPDRFLNVPMAFKNLSSGSKVSETESIKAAYDLTPGKYRYVKSFFYENYHQSLNIKLPFEVTNTIVYGSDISMTLDGYKNGRLSYTIENQTGDTIWYSIYTYSIYKEMDGKWVYLGPDTSQPIPCVIESLANGEKESYTLDMLGKFDLTPGNYRFDMSFGFGSDIRLSLPFEITNTTVYQSGIAVTLDNYADGILDFTIENCRYGEEIKYSYDDYLLQKESNGEWVTLEPVRTFPVCNECVTLAYKESNSQTVNLTWGYDLEPGNYRFVKAFGEYGEIALPFEVTKENTNITPVIVSQEGISVVLDNYENGALSYTIINQTGKNIRYSYSAIEEKMNNGEWAMLKLCVEKSENTDGQVEKDMTKKNTVQLGLNEGSYRYWITFTLEGDEEADTQQITLKLPFEVK